MNIQDIEKELINILIEKSRLQNRLLQYNNHEHMRIMLNQYNIVCNEVEDIDIVYVNIKAEDELRNKKVLNQKE